MNKFFLGIVFIAILFQSCFILKKKDKIQDGSFPEALENEVIIEQKDVRKLYKQREKIIENLEERALNNPATYAAKLKINTNTNGKALNIGAQLRIKTDSLIWTSISVIGAIEVARAQVSPDSIQVMNRIASEYIVRPFDFLYDYVGKDVNYAMFQSILSGYVVKELVNKDLDISYLNPNSTQEIALKGETESYTYTIKCDGQNQVLGYIIRNKTINQNIEVSYTKFEKIGGYFYPSQTQLKTNQGIDTFVAEIDYSRIEINIPLNFPFTVPDKYELK